MKRFEHSTGSFVPVIRNRVVTPEGFPDGNLLRSDDDTVVFDDIGEWLDLEDGGPGHILMPIVHNCRRPHDGDMTIKSPQYFLVVNNPGADPIQDLLEDETGSVVVDEFLETLSVNL